MFLLSPAGKSFLESDGNRFQAGQFQHPGLIRKIQYRFFEPDAPAPAQGYPIYVWLHGLTGRGYDNQSQISFGGNHDVPQWLISPEVQQTHPGYIFAPQCPGGLFWVHFGLPRSAAPLRIAMLALAQFIADHPIDPSRVYVLGQSMGGFATWSLLAEYPEWFAAAVPMAGGGRPGKAKTIAQTPVWAFHGDRDNIVRVWRTRQMFRAVQKQGGPIRYTEIPDGTHYIWNKVIAEPGLLEWLNKKQKLDSAFFKSKETTVLQP
jgi:predicted peptidase